MILTLLRRLTHSLGNTPQIPTPRKEAFNWIAMKGFNIGFGLGFIRGQIKDGEALGPELWGQNEVDYTEILAGGSTFTESGGVFTLTRGIGNAAVQQLVTTQNVTYKIVIVVTDISGLDLALTNVFDSVVMDLSSLGVGTHTVEYTQTAALSHLIIRTTIDSETVSWSSMSVKEVL